MTPLLQFISLNSHFQLPFQQKIKGHPLESVNVKPQHNAHIKTVDFQGPSPVSVNKNEAGKVTQ